MPQRALPSPLPGSANARCRLHARARAADSLDIDGREVLSADMTLEAFDAKHILGMIVGAVMVGCFTIGLPVFMAWMLRTHRKQVMHSEYVDAMRVCAVDHGSAARAVRCSS